MIREVAREAAREAARTVAAALVAVGVAGYLVLRPIVRRDTKPGNERRPRTGPLPPR